MSGDESVDAQKQIYLAFASPPWCKVVTVMKRRVTKKNAERRGMKSQKISLVRASISFPPDLYENLADLAKQKKVSLAWVVRDAAERYVADEAGAKGQQTVHGTAAKLTRKAT